MSSLKGAQPENAQGPGWVLGSGQCSRTMSKATERALRPLSTESGDSERGLDTKEGRWTVATGPPLSPIYRHSQVKLG